jgi:hypothetical protein
MNSPRLRIIAGKDRIIKTGLIIILTKAKMNPATTAAMSTEVLSAPRWIRDAPKIPAATHKPSPETNHLAKKRVNKRLVSILISYSNSLI